MEPLRSKKQQNKVNMKKAIVKKLIQIASTLPDVYEVKPHQQTGQQLLDKKVTRDEHGKKIVPTAIYHGMLRQKVDHLTKLKAEYKKGGDAAVSTYSVNAVKKHSEQNKQKAPVVNTI